MFMLCVEELVVLLCRTALYFLTQRCSSTSDIFCTKGWFHCRAVRLGCIILLLCPPHICLWCRCMCPRLRQALSEILNPSSLLSNNCYHLLCSQTKSLRLENKKINKRKEKGRRDGSTVTQLMRFKFFAQVRRNVSNNWFSNKSRRAQIIDWRGRRHQ